MYELSMTLNEPIEDIIILQQGDVPVLQVTLFDWDGTAWDEGYDAYLVIGRSKTDPTEWEFDDQVAMVPVDNVFYFQLENICDTRGIYWAHVHVVNADEATPLATPEDVEYSFLFFKIEVV